MIRSVFMPGTLYIVATPIGNREDITDRARRVLSEVDIIAAEDTRTTQGLLHMLDIKNRTIANHKFNEYGKSDYLVSELLSGKDIAVVSDAGMPCISDPGGIAVKSAVDAGIPVVGIPGACAAITALSVSGFDCTAFAFYGFLPKTEKEIRPLIDSIMKRDVAVCVFYESPRRIKKTMQIFADISPEADCCLCNDLTKLHERIYRGKPADVYDELTGNPSSEKGEYTVVVQFPETKQESPEKAMLLSPEALIVDHMVKNGCSMKEALAALAADYKGKISKKEFYAAGLVLKELLG
jgi:16S rRNA (cytidine1402-2'-O)-methyltransferase